VEAEGSETVADLKAKIQETHGHPVENQKIIFSGRPDLCILNIPNLIISLGKVLTDSKTIESCDIKEKDFLVLMVSKVCMFSVDPRPLTDNPTNSLELLPQPPQACSLLIHPPRSHQPLRLWPQSQRQLSSKLRLLSPPPRVPTPLPQRLRLRLQRLRWPCNKRELLEIRLLSYQGSSCKRQSIT
jgi:hypothetical protein